MRQKKTTIAKMSVVRECSSKSVALVLSRCCWALHLPSRRRLKRGSEGNPVYTSISPHKILHVDIERKSLHALTTLLRQGDSRKIHFCSFGEKQKYMTMVQNSAEEKKMTLEREEFMNECE